MANSPLQKIVIESQGRGAELKYGPGNNQYCRASDFNPVVDYINNLAGINAVTGTITSNAATINAPAGKFTTASLSTAAGAAATAQTITNSYVTTTSIVIATITGYSGTTGIPVISRCVPSAGSVAITIGNAGAAVLNGTVTVSFIVL